MNSGVTDLRIGTAGLGGFALAPSLLRSAKEA